MMNFFAEIAATSANPALVFGFAAANVIAMIVAFAFSNHKGDFQVFGICFAVCVVAHICLGYLAGGLTTLKVLVLELIALCAVSGVLIAAVVVFGMSYWLIMCMTEHYFTNTYIIEPCDRILRCLSKKYNEKRTAQDKAEAEYEERRRQALEWMDHHY